MDHQRPDPDHADSPSQGARIEDDFLRPVKPMKSASRRRLPAALPFALAGLLVVTSVAFGYVEDGGYWGAIDPSAHSWTGKIEPGAWRIKVEAVYYPDGAAKAAESYVLNLTVAEPTPTASLPPMQSLSLSWVDNLDGTYTFDWNAYTGGWAFDYYKLVYSPSGDPSYGAPGSTATAIPSSQTTWTGPVPSGVNVRVQAVGSPHGSVFIFGQTNVVSLP